MWGLDTPCGIWMSTTLYINITAQNLLSWKIVGDAECQGGGWADFEACHQRTTQAFPCQVHLAASLKTNTECCLDWEPHRAWQVPFSHVCLLWISAGQVQQWPSPVFWVSVQPRYRNPSSSSVRSLGWASGSPGGAAARQCRFSERNSEPGRTWRAAATRVQVVRQWDSTRRFLPWKAVVCSLKIFIVIFVQGNASHWGKCGISVKKNCPEILPLIFLSTSFQCLFRCLRVRLRVCITVVNCSVCLVVYAELCTALKKLWTFIPLRKWLWSLSQSSVIISLF